MIRAKDVLLRFIGALDSTGIPHAIGGSLASGVHGQPRTTHDFNLLVEMASEHVRSVIDALGPAFYSDEASMREASRKKSSFNVIHIESAQKIDVFVSSGKGLDAEQIRRRIEARLESGDPKLFVTSAEVIILRKLDWYRRGSLASERQMRDVVSVLREQRGRLDDSYLDRTAAELDLSELLSQARRSAS